VARELKVRIEIDDQQAQQKLAGTEQSLQRITKSAEDAGKKTDQFSQSTARAGTSSTQLGAAVQQAATRAGTLSTSVAAAAANTTRLGTSMQSATASVSGAQRSLDRVAAAAVEADKKWSTSQFNYQQGARASVTATAQLGAAMQQTSTQSTTLGGATGAAGTSMTRAAQASTSLSTELLKTGVQMFGLTSYVSKLATVTTDLFTRGFQFEPVRQSFTRLADSVGQDSDRMLDAMREGTRGLVKDLELMQSANKAVLLGLPVTTEEMGKLSTAATTLGRAMGLTATQALDNLITALGRSSPLILDNLGITVNASEANEKFARSLGKVASDLTETERKMAFYREAMEKIDQRTQQLGPNTLSMSEQIKRAWTEATSSIEDGISKLDKNLPYLLEDLWSGGPIGPLIGARGTQRSIQDQEREAMAAAMASMPKVGSAFENMGSGLATSTAGANAALAAFDKLNGTTEEMAKRFDKSAAAAEKHATALKSMSDQFTGKKLAEEVKLFTQAFDDAAKKGGIHQSQVESMVDTIDKFILAGAKVPDHIMSWFSEQTLGVLETGSSAIDRVAQSFKHVAQEVVKLETDTAGFLRQFPLIVSNVKPPPFEPWMRWGNNFANLLNDIQGKFDSLGSKLTTTIQGWISGPVGAALGGFGKAVTGALGNMLTSGLASLVNMGAQMVWNGLKALGGAIASAFGANATKGDREGFAKSMGFGGKNPLGELYDHLRGLGPEGERLAIIGSQVVGKNDKEGNQMWMQEVAAFLSRSGFSAFDQRFGTNPFGGNRSADWSGGGMVDPGGLLPPSDGMEELHGLTPPPQQNPAQQTFNITINNNIEAWDGQSVGDWLRNGGDRVLVQGIREKLADEYRAIGWA
jgi:hypothetical protein